MSTEKLPRPTEAARGLRHIADLLEHHPDLPLWVSSTTCRVEPQGGMDTIFDVRYRFARYVKALGKHVKLSTFGGVYRASRTYAGDVDISIEVEAPAIGASAGLWPQTILDAAPAHAREGLRPMPAGAKAETETAVF